MQYRNYTISDLTNDKVVILNLFLSLGHAIGAAGIYLSWDKNQDKEITKDEVFNFFLVNCKLYVSYEVFLILVFFTAHVPLNSGGGGGEWRFFGCHLKGQT